VVEGINPIKGVTYEMAVTFNLNLIDTRPPTNPPKIKNITYIYVDEPEPLNSDVKAPEKIHLVQYGMNILTGLIIFSILLYALVYFLSHLLRRF